MQPVGVLIGFGLVPFMSIAFESGTNQDRISCPVKHMVAMFYQIIKFQDERGKSLGLPKIK